MSFFKKEMKEKKKEQARKVCGTVYHNLTIA